ncbi:MAG: acyltransferase [Proteobacteria bacterium]|nr:MAG: acyltransferase [Pseudomonadota bacterium]
MRKSLNFPGPLTIPASASYALDFMRAISALLVLLSHVRPLFFVDFALVEKKSPLVKMFYLLTGLGHESVVIFFVLSGLLIGVSVLRVHTRNSWNWRDYLLQRMSRLWVVLIPALFLTLFWDWNGMRLFGTDSVYSGLPSDKFILGFNTFERLDTKTFFQNVFFLQGTTGVTFGTNGPLWSLAYEFWYYIAFPCVLGIYTAPSTLSKLTHLVLLILMGVFLGRDILFYFPLWLMGVAILFLPKLWRNYKSASPVWIGISIGILFLSLIVSALKNNNWLSYVIGFSCIALIYFVFRLPSADPSTHVDVKSTKNPRHSLIKRMADFSFSLYVLHLPPLVFLHGLLWQRGIEKWQPSLTSIALGTVISLSVILYAYVISLLTENHTDKVRRWVKKKLFERPLVAV